MKKIVFFILLIFLAAHASATASDFNATIAYGADTINSLTTDINFSTFYVPTQMAFSCDNSTWSTWETFSSIKKNFNFASGNSGCILQGEGIYAVYVSFTDGVDVNGASDSIQILGTTKSQTMYVSPDEPASSQTTTYSIGNIDFGAAIFILALLGAAAYVVYSARKKAGGR